jgi:hypothetical protein
MVPRASCVAKTRHNADRVVTGAAQGEARPSAARRFLCQHNKVVYGSNLLMMLECLQGY